MNEKTLTVRSLTPLTKDTCALVLEGDCGTAQPGQFADLKLPGRFLRRPISIWDAAGDHLDLLFKVMGQGTRELAAMTPGSTLDVLLPLGTGFDVADQGTAPVLAAGGIGMPPIYACAKAMTALGQTPRVVLGFNSKEDILPLDRFRDLGIEPVLTTADGSAGQKGFVTDALKSMEFDYLFCCGPAPMLRAVLPLAPDGQFSLEERMGCGFGACMGCSIETPDGPRRVCKDGPVFRKADLALWAGGKEAAR